jgi:hypothetical protein
LGHIPIDPNIVIKCDAGTPFVNDPEASTVKTTFMKLSEQVIKTVERRKDETTSVAH